MTRSGLRRRPVTAPAYFLGRPSTAYLGRYSRAKVTSLGVRRGRPVAGTSVDFEAA
jgi:hypothetical protein